MNLNQIQLIDEIILKASIKDKIEKLIARMTELLTTAWTDNVKLAVKNVASWLGMLKDKPLLNTEIEPIINELSNSLIGNVTLDTAALLSIEKAAYAMGKSNVAIAFGLPDIKSLQVIDTSTRYWVGSYFDDNVQEGLKAVLQDFYAGNSLSGGLYNRQGVIDLLKTHFKDLTDKTDNYWDMLADHICTKTRVIGQIAGYEQAGIKYLKFVAHIDNKTSEICRKMNGKIIKVADARNQVDKYLKTCQTNDKDKIKATWNWDNNYVSGGLKLPPLHARCRSITVAYQP